MAKPNESVLRNNRNALGQPQCNDKQSKPIDSPTLCIYVYSLCQSKPKQFIETWHDPILFRSSSLLFLFLSFSLENLSIPSEIYCQAKSRLLHFHYACSLVLLSARSLFSVRFFLSLSPQTEKRKHICRTWFSSDSVRWWCFCPLTFFCSTVLCMSNGNNDHTN